MWNKRFLELAEHVSTWSKDPSTKVGAVIVDDKNRIISLGFNGLPRGISDDERLEDRETKYKLIIHAEENAILFANKDLSGCKIYTWPLPPCSRCASKIIQVGITDVYWDGLNGIPHRWKSDIEISCNLLREAKINIWKDFKLNNEK